MNIYIKGLGNISPQNSFKTDLFLEPVKEYKNNYLRCVEPDYTEFISANAARRMGKVIKNGVAASMLCLQDADVAYPDAIITGTGLGCVEDTERFLTSLIHNQEQLLTPTSFIQSTHNTISAQIALLLQCTNYNFTYVHRGFSFESSLLDGILQLKGGQARNILVGGADEMTPNTFKIMQRLGHWKKEFVSNLDLFNTNTTGTIAGEGASFFILSSEEEGKKYARLHSVATLYKPESYDYIERKISRFLEEAQLLPEEIDLVIAGTNGDYAMDVPYRQLQKDYFAKNHWAYFKHLCGEYHTASSFALWLAASIVYKQIVPDIVMKNKRTIKKDIKNVLIYNHYRNINHSLFLIQKV